MLMLWILVGVFIDAQCVCVYNYIYMREMLKRIGALLKILLLILFLILHWKKMHGLKNWSLPGIEPGSMALNAIAFIDPIEWTLSPK